nr:CCA tRNA nucleotidyltransferase [Kushneria aurantia]
MRFAHDAAVAGLACYCVGGAVRDELLGIPHTDRDWIVVGATAEDMTRRGFRPVGRDFPVFLHPYSHEEYALARTERKSGRGYTGFVVHAEPTVTLEEDLERRDFTINAMALDAEGRIIDPFGGRADCEARVLRHVSPAFAEDPLRILRAARFVARLRPCGFAVAEATLDLMKAMVAAGEVEALVAERVWQEVERALNAPAAEAFFELLDDCGALTVLIPELEGRLAAGLERMTAGADAPARLALLLADLGVDALSALSERLRLPNTFRERALMVADSRALLDSAPDAEQVLQWCRAMDAWRRPQRLEALLATLDAGGFELPIAQLVRAVAAAREVSPQGLMGAGYRGAELGLMIESERERLIAQALLASS